MGKKVQRTHVLQTLREKIMTYKEHCPTCYENIDQPSTKEKPVFTNFIATPETNDNFLMAGDKIIAQKVDVKDAELIIASLNSRQHLVAALKEAREHLFNRNMKMPRGRLLEYIAYALAIGEGREPQSYFDPNRIFTKDDLQ